MTLIAIRCHISEPLHKRGTNPNQYQDEKDVKVYGMLIGHQCGNTFSGDSEIPGNDFVLSLGGFPGGGNVVQQESALIMSWVIPWVLTTVVAPDSKL